MFMQVKDVILEQGPEGIGIRLKVGFYSDGICVKYIVIYAVLVRTTLGWIRC